jgi:hypothetical protein
VFRRGTTALARAGCRGSRLAGQKEAGNRRGSLGGRGSAGPWPDTAVGEAVRAAEERSPGGVRRGTRCRRGDGSSELCHGVDVGRTVAGPRRCGGWRGRRRRARGAGARGEMWDERGKYLLASKSKDKAARLGARGASAPVGQCSDAAQRSGGNWQWRRARSCVARSALHGARWGGRAEGFSRWAGPVQTSWAALLRWAGLVKMFFHLFQLALI